jgi:hypothetical protein
MITLRPARRDHRFMNAAMINIQIAGMVSINSIGRTLADVLFHNFHDFEQRLGIEAIIRKPMHRQVLHSEDVGRRSSCSLTLFDSVSSRMRIAARFAVCEDDSPDLIPR